MTGALTQTDTLTVDALCRLMKGRDLSSVIEAVQNKVCNESTPVAEIAALQTWVWQLTLHIAHALAQVWGCTFICSMHLGLCVV